MGSVLRFHATSRLKPKMARSKVRSRRANSAEKSKKYSGGMAPDAFQLLTDDLPTPARAAAATVPPNASMTCATVESMALNSSESLNLSRVQNFGIADSGKMNFPRPMDRREQIAGRLKFLPKVWGMTQKDFAESIGTSKSGYSNWLSAARDEKITLEHAIRLYKNYHIPVEWVCLGDWTMVLHKDVHTKLLEVERLMEASKPPSGRRRPHKSSGKAA